MTSWAMFAYAMRVAAPGPRIVAMRKIGTWGGAGKISEALGQDRWGSLLPINRYFFCFADREFGSSAG